MKPVPLQPNLPTPTTAFGNPAPIAQYYICPHCKKQSPLVKEWVGLTDAELAEFSEAKLGAYDLCLEVEAKLKEKNNG